MLQIYSMYYYKFSEERKIWFIISKMTSVKMPEQIIIESDQKLFGVGVIIQQHQASFQI